jgi:Tfp pilus assembly protein PilF
MITGLHDPHRERALILMDQRRYAMAANELRAHLASEPDDPYARSLLARCLANQRMLKEAMDEVRAAISSSPT